MYFSVYFLNSTFLIGQVEAILTFVAKVSKYNQPPWCW